ncbi:MAG: dTDP-4-dehydrorhamnose reductase [Ardenticatenales bacterium]|jgi:dTDP-4-dehydrorhamnose reductase|nr:dTDP-4-dehydrorhamnose reductase [Ardenticatenales bacterium]
MRILILGADGQLGRAIARRAVGHDVVAAPRTRIDVTRPDASDAVAAVRADVVVNAAAFTDVDRCEREPEAAFGGNAVGAWRAASGAAASGAAFVQVSTDYVFDGRKGAPYVEDDAPAPISVYGASKLAGEHLVRAVQPAHYVVRTAWLYGLGGRGFVQRMLALSGERDRLAVVDNEVGNPTFCDDLADGILALVATGTYGTYHLTNEGSCSRWDLARAALDRAGRRDFPIDRAAAFPRLARPPAYAPLANRAAAALGIRLPAWESGLEAFFERGGHPDTAAGVADVPARVRS